jgi:DNA-binding CsgD family transcriptional regulator
MNEAITEIYKNRLPWHGFATDDPSCGLYMYPLPELIKKTLVQHNAKHSLAWLVYDLDSPTACLDWQESENPPPNIAVINRENGHAHLFYGLEKPVHNYEGASNKALHYMAAVDIALTFALEADPGYSKLISKNPLHDKWLTFFPRTDLYTLEELADWVDISQFKDRRKKLPAVGLGRNCTLFEDLRRWAYRERRKPQQYFSFDMFHQAVMMQGLQINAQFTPQLPHSEVRSTAKSIAKWTWRNMSPEGFKAWSKNRRQKSINTKKEKTLSLREQILQIKKELPELNQTDIAAMLNVTRRTVSNHLRAAKSCLSDITHFSLDPQAEKSCLSDITHVTLDPQAEKSCLSDIGNLYS